MSYTINPNAKNKWARNAENTMDLSLETDASSVYLDNGRTLEQEIGEGSMVSNVATVDSAMSKIIDGTLDGAYESLVFKGKSLVNIVNYSNGDITSGNSVDLTTGTITLKGRNGWSNAFLKYQQMKPSTKYLCWVNILQVTGTVDYLQVISSSNQASAFTNAWRVESPSVGFYKNIMTSETDLTDRKYVFRSYVGSGSNGATIQYQVGCVEYQEGMENWDIPCFTGIGSVKMPILRNVGKNLLPNIEMESGGLNATGTTIKDDTRIRPVDFIPFYENLTYTKSNVEYIYFYDENKVFFDRSASNTFTSPVGTRYIKFRTSKDSFDMQIEQGTQATTYEPHKSNILRTSEEIVLREVGGVYDTYNPLTGEYVRRIGEVVLDGSENWTIHNNDHSNRIVFKTSSKLSGYNTTTSIADKIRTSKITTGISNLFGYSFLRIGEDTAAPTAGVFLHLEGELISISNVAKLTEWLQANPITVQYELKTPITTIVESLTTPFAYQNGHIILESGYEGQSLLPTLEYSTVINKTGQIESVAKTIQRQEKQLTMLEQMLIQNIINLDYNNTLLTLKNEMEEML